ncbi:hypothetical protein JYU34_004376 [Plutella xylostella]|uniref:FLYWCH-type domain-containing protein n=1 Tax=Plutella xylostella TaxID=51655 RepID=A0ABQ7QXU9_PLUXY|nr:hypothetical protein JYU34_004376 [Plutella xylostella]
MGRQSSGLRYCSQRQAATCPARIRLHHTGGLDVIESAHNHPPPKYVKTSTGHYVKC